MKRCSTCGSEFADDALYCQWDGAPLASESAEVDPYVGHVVKDQFELLAPIGQGGMGTVYRAVQRGFDRTVAVKILHSDLARSPEVLARFHREAKIASRLEHPNIVHVYQFGDLPDGNLFLAMEFLDGRSVLEVLRADGAIEIGRALHIAQQICAALGEAHEAGIIHRDLKPENIMLVRRGSDPDFVKILDFGIAKFVTSEGQGDIHTQQGLVFGTARYISPEGASGDPVDARSDVYSLGVVLYQMLSGEVPFHSENPISLLLMHINDKPPPMRSKARAAHVPPAVEEVVMRALTKRPADRYANAREFGQALLDAAGRSSLALPPVSGSPRRASEAAAAGARPVPASIAPPPEPAGGALPPMIRTLEGPAVAPEDAKEPAFVGSWQAPRQMPATRLQAAVSLEELEERATSILAASTHAGAIAPAPSEDRPSRADPLARTDPAGTPVDSQSMEAVRLPSNRAPIVIVLVVVLLLGAAAAAVAYVRTRGPSVPGQGPDIAAAEAALAAGRLTSTAGDGAVDLLERARAATPTDPSIVDLRNRVVARLESDADQARREGRLANARDALRLLLRVDPAHPRARASLDGIERALGPSGGPTTEGPSGPSLQPVSGPPVSGGPPAAVVTVSETAFVGRVVHLTARLTGLARGVAFTEPRFRVARRVQGEAATPVVATTGGDPGSFVAEFTFSKQGTWDVTFSVSTGAASPIEGTLAVQVHVPTPGGPFTTGGGSADVDPPDGGTTGITTPVTGDGGVGTIHTPPEKPPRRRRPPPDGGGGGRWM
jgi:serine/threonine-protein kinase